MIRKLWPLLIGFAIWALAFVALYAVQALGCAWGWPEAMHRTVLLAIWIATVGILCVVLLRQWRQPPGPEPSLRHTRIFLTMTATAAAVITYSPVAFISLCL